MPRSARAKWVVLAGLLAAAVLGVSGSAASPGTITGRVTQLEGGTGLANAVVTVAGPGQAPETAVTAEGGSFEIDVSGTGPYSVGVQADGFASQSVRDVQTGAALDIALAPATFTPLPIDGGEAQETEADAKSGVFYALMNQAPEIYRTLDYGGTWQRVTMSYEDPETGIARGASTLDALATSSVPGEVAVINRSGSSYFSKDYGLTWRAVGGERLPPTGGLPTTVLAFWGHARPGAPSVLLAGQVDESGAWDVLRADMSAADPTFASEGSDPFGAGSVIDVADSEDGSFVGRVNAGELSFAPLTASGAISFGPPEAGGLPNPAVALRLGGVKEPASPPNGAIVMGGNGPPFTARMLTKDAGANSFSGASASGSTSIPADCRFRDNPFSAGRTSASVAPTSTGTTGGGTASECWLAKDDGADLTVTAISVSAFGDFAYDANWGSGNHVGFATHPDGPHKSARLNADGVPEFPPPDETADRGFAEDSGGIAVDGIDTAGVADIAYGPGADQKLALAVPGAQMRLASSDGGATMHLVGTRSWGADNVQWWQGASGEWLAFGAGQGPDQQLTAALDWDPSQPPISGGGNVTGSRPEDLGGAAGEGTGIEAMAAIPGTDMVFLGVGRPFDPVTDDNDLFRVRIQPGSPPSLVDKFNFEPFLNGTSLFVPGALAYCPSSSAREDMRDVLFVAMAEGGGIAPAAGGVLRVSAATTDLPRVVGIDSVPDLPVLDLRADCGAGIVYAGGVGGGRLYRSTDGGVTFQTIQIPPPAGGFGGPVTAIGLNPADPDDVTVATGQGNILHSSDAANTEAAPSWAQVNDPETQRKIQVNDIEFAPGAGAPTILRSAQASSGGDGSAEEALLGTGGGAFEANVGVSGGIIAFSGAGWLGNQLTTVIDDAEPSLAVDPASGLSYAVFRRANGLAFSAATGGSWSIPVPIPGTVAGDAEPSVALDPGRGLELAFRRPSGPAPGIYHMTVGAGGVSSAPERVSDNRGDSLPALAVTGRARPSAGIAFLRAKGRKRSRGIRVAVRRGARWRTAKVPRTNPGDAKTKLGGPALAARGKKLHLAFARPGRRGGVAYALLKRKRWSKPEPLTRRRDAEPSLVLAGKTKHVVFRRRAGKRKSGLYAVSGSRKWKKVKRVRGTTADDRAPTLATSPSGLLALSFARTAGETPGVYYATPRGSRWRNVPQRVSSNPLDTGPAPAIDAQGRVTIIVARR